VRPNCRLQVLYIAQEGGAAHSSFLGDSTRPCHCFNTSAYHLQNVRKVLDQSLYERAFDLYFQSPWVSGSHIVETMETSFYYSLRLFNCLLYVPSLCHVYNALRRCTIFESISLLEELYKTFKDILFPCGLPGETSKHLLSATKTADFASTSTTPTTSLAVIT
jgi:hypothetical protein